MALALREQLYSAPYLTERQLVRAVRRGDDRAFEQLFSRYRRRISAYAYGLVGDHGRAEDITQEVFIAALRRLRETERPIAFRPWIYEIARNACIDEYRRARRANLVPVDDEERERGMQIPRLADDASPEVRWEQKEQLENLRGAITGLSPQHHQILVLRELEGLSYDEIGTRMGMSRTEVESTLFRARRRLSQEYDELVSGRRCHDVRLAVDQHSVRSLASRGIRERRRIAHHLEHCHDCLRYARANGVDDASLRVPGLAGRAAAFLPFGWLRLLWPSRRSGWLGPGNGHAAVLGRVAAGATAALIAGGVPAAIVLEHHHAAAPSKAPANASPVLAVVSAPASASAPAHRALPVPRRSAPHVPRQTASASRRRHRAAPAAGRAHAPRTSTSPTPIASRPGQGTAGGAASAAPVGTMTTAAVTSAPLGVASKLSAAGGAVLASTGSAVSSTLSSTVGAVQQTLTGAAGAVSSLLPTVSAPTITAPATVLGTTVGVAPPTVSVSPPSVTTPVVTTSVPLLSPAPTSTPAVTVAAPARDTGPAGGSPVPLVQVRTVAVAH